MQTKAVKRKKKQLCIPLVYCIALALVIGGNLFVAKRLSKSKERIEHTHDLPLIPLPLRSLVDGQGITWLGDNWVPPKGCRVYSIPELHVIFSRFSILWIGDSTVRRVYASLRAILNNDKNSTSISIDAVNSPHVIDVNKDAVQERCHKWKHLDWIDPTSLCSNLSSNNRAFDFIQVRCLKDFPPILQNISSLEHYDLVVVSGGSWDFAPLKRRECSGRRRFPDVLWKHLASVLQELHSLQSPYRHVVWRTLAMNQHELEKDVWKQYNRRCVQNLTSTNLTTIDVATALEPRSVMYERIEGNNIYHLGLKGRLLFIQMLANHLLLKMEEWRHGV